jgi:hypothetical protein
MVNMDWESLFKRYVWDSQTTPYFTAVSKLTRVQANYEVLAFCLFFGVLFAVVALGALTEKAMFGRSPILGLYAFSVVAGSVVFNYTKVVWSAVYISAAPLSVLIYVVIYGFSDKALRMDSFIVAGGVLLMLLYAPRLIGIARAYPNMKEGDEPPKRRRLFK